LARHPATAMLALVHALALATFFRAAEALAWRSRLCVASKPAGMAFCSTNSFVREAP